MSEIPEIQNIVAIRVLSHCQSKSQKFSLDPATIILICNCIISVIKLLYICYSKQGAAQAFKKSSLIHDIVLRREIRRRFKSRDERKAMYRSMKDVAQALSEVELNQLVDSI